MVKILHYTMINNTQYQLETAIRTIDLCFKLYHVLNLEYPPKAEQIWYFFEQYFFEILNPPKKKKFYLFKVCARIYNSHNLSFCKLHCILNTSNMFNCFLCNLKFNNINYLIIHLSIYHNLNEIKEFVCKATNCLRSLKSI